MPSGDKQQPVSVKKVALRELLSEASNIIPKLPTSSPLSKEKGLLDPPKVGAKRQRPDSLFSSPSTQTAQGNAMANGHLVYVRRKVDPESGKLSSPESKKCTSFTDKASKVQQDELKEPRVSPSQAAPAPVASPTPPSGGPSLLPSLNDKTNGPPGPSESVVNTVNAATDGHQTINWGERFLRLQLCLKHCDQSSQEEHVKMLRSLPAAGRSRHAVELEKRAISLMMEEGLELQRMNSLNIFGWKNVV